MKINGKDFALVLFVLSTILFLGSTVDAYADVRGGSGTGSIEACLNAGQPPNFFPCDTDVEWKGGNITNDAGYKEGSSIPMRVDITGLDNSTDVYNVLVIEYQITKIQSGDVQHAFDYITSFNNNDSPHPCLELLPREVCEDWEFATIAIPEPPINTIVSINTTTTDQPQPAFSFNNSLNATQKLFYIFSPEGTMIDINSIGYVAGEEGDPGDTQNSQNTQLWVNYTGNSPDVIAAFGAHVASPVDWEFGADSITGKAFHFGCKEVHAGGGCSGGAINLDAFQVIASISAPELTLKKFVNATNGGDADAGDWELFANDGTQNNNKKVEGLLQLACGVGS